MESDRHGEPAAEIWHRSRAGDSLGASADPKSSVPPQPSLLAPTIRTLQALIFYMG